MSVLCITNELLSIYPTKLATFETVHYFAVLARGQATDELGRDRRTNYQDVVLILIFFCGNNERKFLEGRRVVAMTRLRIGLIALGRIKPRRKYPGSNPKTSQIFLNEKIHSLSSSVVTQCLAS